MKGNMGLGGHVFRQPFVEIGDGIPVGNLGAASLQDFAITFDQSQRLLRFRARSRIHRFERSQLEREIPEEANAPAQPAAFPGGS